MAYFPNQIAQNGAPVLDAFLTSCHRHGIVTQENSLDADVAVIWSVLWAGRMRDNHDIYRHYRNQHRPVIIIDVGSLVRGVTWKIAVNNITAQGQYGHYRDLDPDRPSRLGIGLGRHRTGDSVLIAAQHARSLQVAPLTSMADWIRQQIENVRRVTDRPIRVRPHPRSPLRITGVEIETPRQMANTYDDFDLGFDYHAVINYNSGVGIKAALAGTPVIVDDTSLARPVAIGYNELASPPEQDRSAWLIEIAHTEYTLEEIREGQWLKRLQNYL